MTLKRDTLLNTLMNPTYGLIALGWGVLFFDISYFAMKNFAGSPPGVLMCLESGALTPRNIVFSIVLSVLTGALLAGLIKLFAQKIELYKQKRETSATSALSSVGVSSIGGLIGLFTVFCPFCTFGVVTLFGFSLGLEFFVMYNTWIKVVSILIMVLCLWWIDAQIKQDCLVCRVISKEK